jgi:hypothetical protein
MAIATIGGGAQIGDGNLAEVALSVIPAPLTATATANLSVAQLTNGILLGSPGASAASYTLPTVAALEAALVNSKVGSSFPVSVINVDGNGSGVITLVTNTGWTLVGLMTVAATAGTVQLFRARKSGDGAWVLYRYG